MAVSRTAVFLTTLSDSQLLAAAQVEEIKRSPLAKNDDPTPLAKDLIQRGVLTQWQANQLIQGRGKSLILGPYRLLDRLGEGGMGSVYKAHHLPMNRVVALKTIKKEKLQSVTTARRFFQEMRVISQLSHPNIVAAYDAGQAGDTHYLAMELVEGSDLRKLVKRGGALPPGEACEYVRQAALGLQHAHEKGLVHRDIKPHNLFVDRHGTVKLLDMGLVRTETPDGGESSLTKVGTVVGTPDYLAPEQAKNAHTVDIRADVYSLGCTLFYLLAGQPPFLGDTVTEILVKHQLEAPPSLEQFRGDVPKDVQAIVKKLLAKKPEDRFQTPAEVAAALAPFAQKRDRSASSKSSGTTQKMVAVQRPKKKTNLWAGIHDEDAAQHRPFRRRSRGRRLVLALGVLLSAVVGVVLAAAHYPELVPFQNGTQGAAVTTDATPTPPTVTRPETKPATKTEPKIEPKTEPKVEPKTEPKVEPKTEPKVEPKVEPKTEPKVEPKVEPKTPPRVEPSFPVKQPVPDAGRLLEAQKQVQEKYAADYARKTPADRQALAQKLFKEALSTPRDNAVYRYVLFHEATNRAFDAGDLDLTLRIIDEVDRRYIIDALAGRLQVLSGAVQSQQPPAAMKSFAETALDLADDCVAEDNFAGAKALLELAEVAAKKANNPAVVTQVQSRAKEIAEIAGDYPDARRAAETVFLKSPKDLQASWRWGRYLGCLKGDWDVALPWIAQSGEARFSSQAKKDLAQPKDGQAQLELADGWWELAEDAQGVARKELYLRAKFWYEQALVKLSPLSRGRVERRLKELPKLLSGEEPVVEKPPSGLIPKETYERQLAMGQNFLRLQLFNKSIDAFSQALKYKPGDPTATVGLNDARYGQHMANGNAFMAGKKYGQAVDEYEAALRAKPNDTAATNALSQARFRVLNEKMAK